MAKNWIRVCRPSVGTGCQNVCSGPKISWNFDSDSEDRQKLGPQTSIPDEILKVNKAVFYKIIIFPYLHQKILRNLTPNDATNENHP